MGQPYLILLSSIFPKVSSPLLKKKELTRTVFKCDVLTWWYRFHPTIFFSHPGFHFKMRLALHSGDFLICPQQIFLTLKFQGWRVAIPGSNHASGEGHCCPCWIQDHKGDCNQTCPPITKNMSSFWSPLEFGNPLADAIQAFGCPNTTPIS